MEDLVSVIMPCFNSQDFVAEALDSALRQKDCAFEIIAVDDGSRDDSLKVLRGYEERHPGTVRVLTHPGGANKGSGASRNLGLSEARGAHVVFLDSDDRWSDDRALRKLRDVLAAEPELAFVFAPGHAIDETGRRLYAWDTRDAAYMADKENLLVDCFVHIQGVMARMDLVRAVGGYTEGILGQDHDLWVRLAEKGDYRFLDEYIFEYRLHGGQVSHTRRMWEDGFVILRGARERGFYPRRAIRRRRAVLHYRLGEFDLHAGAYLSGLGHMALAAAFDPFRSARVLCGKCLRGR